MDIVSLTAPDGVSVMEQILWPRHCVADTWGAACHPELRSDPSDIIVHKGCEASVDSYSAFFDNSKFRQTTLLPEVNCPPPHGTTPHRHRSPHPPRPATAHPASAAA